MRKIYLIVFVAILSFLSEPFTARSQVLEVPVVIQEHDQWCWAAVAKCVLDYFGFSYDQCEIAEYTRAVATWHDFGNENCCSNPYQGCNHWNYMYGSTGSLSDILDHFGSLITQDQYSYLTIPQIQDQINNLRPFIFRWGWSSGGGHFLVGYGIEENYVYYMDPWFNLGYSIADYDWALSSSGHDWTHSQTFCMPNPPTSILGDSSVCKGMDYEYSVEPVEGATHYSWSLPTGWTGSSSTSSIAVVPSRASGNILVAANNSCGGSIQQKLYVATTSVITMVSQNDYTLTAGADSAIYQWVSCPTMEEIPGETNRAFTASEPGSYAVIVTQFGCTDTTLCFSVPPTGLLLNNKFAAVEVFPNPTNRHLHVKGYDLIPEKLKLSVASITGQVLREKEIELTGNSLETRFDIGNFPSGVYILSINANSFSRVLKIIKH